MSLPESARLLADLVAIPSPTGREEAAARLLVNQLPRFGWTGAHLDGVGNVIASRGSGEKELVILSHIDTVSGGPKIVIDSEKIQGRGSVDAKGPCCALAVAGGLVPVLPGWRVTFVGAVGEEIDSRGARFRMPLHSPAACVIGEPTGSDGVALSYRGRVLFWFEAEDGGAHRSGSPGPMTDVVRATSSLVDITKNMGDGYTTSVVEMDGEEAGTRYGRIQIDLRIPLGAEQEELELMLGETAAAFGVNLNIVEYDPPYGVQKTDRVIRSFRTAIRDAGARPRILAKRGTCDFNVLSPWGCPMGAYGPGDSKYDHSPDEQIPIPEFLRGVEVLKLALPRIMENVA
ncbi:MAG: M20/M25/M40 family metallo-hydrolase [Synergistaceae bacterium]|jgi:LysW-gamma-L-lysine carboxypeptidase|nr:M20/M25/M40 family metallo-hydrolase [Synergistaceae bacterium]